jgi:hypothetical protein
VVGLELGNAWREQRPAKGYKLNANEGHWKDMLKYHRQQHGIKNMKVR